MINKHAPLYFIFPLFPLWSYELYTSLCIQFLVDLGALYCQVFELGEFAGAIGIKVASYRSLFAFLVSR